MRNPLFFVVSVSFLFFSCEKETAEPTFYSGNAQGTTFHITYFSKNNFDAEKGIDSVFHAIDRSMNTYLRNSDISKINRGDTAVVVDAMFVDVFHAAQKVYRESDGFFDPTVGQLVNLYGFGPERYSVKIDSTAIDSLMRYVGLNKIKLTPKKRLQSSAGPIYIDFNAIAQGYAVDRLAAYLNQHQIKNYLIEIGGELIAKGHNLAKEKPWRVGIDTPQKTRKKATFSTIVRLQNIALATSGNYRKFRVDSVTGEKYIHTIDPHSGYPAKNNLLSVSVLAKSCMFADAYATAIMAMGFERAKRFLDKKPEIQAYLVYTEGDSVRTYMTDGFEKQVFKE